MFRYIYIHISNNKPSVSIKNLQDISPVIDQEINTGKDIPTTWIAPERTDLNNPI